MPQRTLASIAHGMASCEIPWVKNYLIRYFINRYPVNLNEAIEKNPYNYPSFNHFFTRALDPNLRPITQGIHDLASPVDGCISQMGILEQEKVVQAKGFLYSVQDLLGGDAKLAAPFINGSYLTAYLAPKDYHRVHMPMDGHLTQLIYIAGNLFSVNPKTTSTIPNIFTRNERVVALFNTSLGQVAVVLVGAMIVGSIEMISIETVTPPHGHNTNIWNYDDPIYLKKGEELGRFKLGSTVILLFEPNKVTWEPEMIANTTINMGQRLGSFTK